MGLPLSKIEAYLGKKAVGHGAKPRSGAVSYVIDSRKVEKGDVFIAIKGPNHDAHDFINKALLEKAALLIVNQTWYDKTKPATGCFIPVKDTVEAMLLMAQRYRKDLGLKIVAVTGSNGKTTTRSMIGRVLARKYRVFETKGNFNNRIGMPLSVFQLEPGHEIAVLEMGTNHFGEIKELSETVHPDMAVVTNIGRGHLESLRNRAGVLKAKMEILCGMPEKGTLIVNGDDDLLRRYLPRKGIRKFTAGFEGRVTLKGRNLSSGLIRGTAFKTENQAVRLRIPGTGAAQDALLSLLVGKEFGLSVREGAKGLLNVKATADRMEILKQGGITWIVDCYNANPDSLNNALRLLKEEKVKGRKIAVLGNMGELGRGSVRFHREAGAMVKECGFDVLLTLGDLGREIAEGARRSGLANSHSYHDQKTVISIIRKSMRSGDVVLVKGSHSMRMEEIAHALIKGTGK